MPSLNLTPDLVARFIPLPGTALIKCSPAELMTDSGMLVKPEAAADWERKGMAVRMGAVVEINRSRRGCEILDRNNSGGHHTPESKGNSDWHDIDSYSIEVGSTVYYLGRQDEADDEYVVVKIGQIVGVRV